MMLTSLCDVVRRVPGRATASAATCVARLAYSSAPSLSPSSLPAAALPVPQELETNSHSPATPGSTALLIAQAIGVTLEHAANPAVAAPGSETSASRLKRSLAAFAQKKAPPRVRRAILFIARLG